MKSDQPFGELVGLAPDPRSRMPDERFVLPNCLIGLELELEELRLDSSAKAKLPWWKLERDGSLRGEHAWELVLSYPLSGKDLMDSLDQVDDLIRAKRHRPTMSHRCSVHVHMDVRDMTVEQIQKMIVVYCAVEPMLFHYVGESRKNNIYCTPISECGVVRKALGASYNADRRTADHLVHSMRTHNKYTALNLKVATNLGSAEFRHMAGAWEKDVLIEWINIIQCIKRYSVDNNTDINMMPLMISNIGPECFMEDLFGSLAPKILERCPPDEFFHDVMRAVRHSQDIINSQQLADTTRDLKGLLAVEHKAPCGINPAFAEKCKKSYDEREHLSWVKANSMKGASPTPHQRSRSRGTGFATMKTIGELVLEENVPYPEHDWTITTTTTDTFG